MPETHFNESSRAFLLSPDPRLATELRDLLSRELPLTSLAALSAYPNRTELRELNAQLCFLDVSSDPARAFTAMSTVGSCCPGLPVIVLLGNDDPGLIMQCLRQGASGFLIQPFTSDQLKASLEKLSRSCAPMQAAAPSQCEIYCVIPVKGACGATTLACNLAYALKRVESKSLLLADLDGLTGTLPFLLKLKSNYSFVDALTVAGSLDADLWKALITNCRGVDVLLSPENRVDSIGDLYDPGPLLGYMRRAYETVVLDTGSAYGDWNSSLARLSDEMLLVTTNELPALHAAQRVLGYLERCGCTRSNVRLVVNRYEGEGRLPQDGISKALGIEVFHTLPSEYPSIQRALMEGKPAPPGSAFGKSVAALAEKLAGCKAREKKGSVFDRLFKRRTADT